ncbi:hypothetical protein [Hymenobacter wooponensis]|uniref:Uncharacterized protein n=1 Tax=Hymenobacter wooponensis TaxID=1525360 RepID=A0A4Z0MN28_9BACT|nr:hypothetical protein [Hymenobacter wooponensis]TGD80756.1 hypothetical protein EU557_13165 [Hymenobacter wooponensis]
MIKNFPTPEDFGKLAQDCLNQAFDVIFDTDKHVYEFYEEALQSEVWEYSQGKLNTAVVLIHQAIEAFMKASICLTSPLLLLEGKRTEWPVMPKQKDKDFNDFYTTPSESLLYTYVATLSRKIDEALVNHIDEIRRLRNQIVHGIPKKKLEPKYLILKVLETHLFFRSKDSWWDSQIESHFNHPLAQYYDATFEFARFAERLDYVEAQIGKSKLAANFTFNIKGRRYLCPVCKGWYEAEAGDEYTHRWAFLKASRKVSTIVQCLNCANETEIVRQNCPYEDCKGTVLLNTDESECCLTCGREIYWPEGYKEAPQVAGSPYDPSIGHVQFDYLTSPNSLIKGNVDNLNE